MKSYGLITPCFARISRMGKSWHINRIFYLENLTSWSGFILVLPLRFIEEHDEHEATRRYRAS